MITELLMIAFVSFAFVLIFKIPERIKQGKTELGILNAVISIILLYGTYWLAS